MTSSMKLSPLIRTWHSNLWPPRSAITSVKILRLQFSSRDSTKGKEDNFNSYWFLSNNKVLTWLLLGGKLDIWNLCRPAMDLDNLSYKNNRRYLWIRSNQILWKLSIFHLPNNVAVINRIQPLNRRFKHSVKINKGLDMKLWKKLMKVKLTLQLQRTSRKRKLNQKCH